MEWKQRASSFWAVCPSAVKAVKAVGEGASSGKAGSGIQTNRNKVISGTGIQTQTTGV